MGLDSYLEGHIYYAAETGHERDGYRVCREHLSLGYWRKHHDLHDCIVEEIAEGVDDCEPLHLTAESLEFLAEGFGESDSKIAAAFQAALAWLKKPEERGVFKNVYYVASW